MERQACCLKVARLKLPGLGALTAESAHGVTGVASLILLADIGDQRLRALHLNFEGGDQGIFRFDHNVSRFPLKFKADRWTCGVKRSSKVRLPVPLKTAATSARARYGPPLTSNAQAMRAILLASATATTLNGLRARSCVNQGYFSGFCRASFNTA